MIVIKICMRGLNTFYRLTAVIFLLTVTPLISKAQDLPCDGTDPYTTCPLDSWVLVAVVIAGLFAANILASQTESYSGLSHSKHRVFIPGVWC